MMKIFEKKTRFQSNLACVVQGGHNHLSACSKRWLQSFWVKPRQVMQREIQGWIDEASLVQFRPQALA
jgi:hypothetical protein